MKRGVSAAQLKAALETLRREDPTAYKAVMILLSPVVEKKSSKQLTLKRRSTKSRRR